MDQDSYFILKMAGKFIQFVAIVSLTILTYNVFHEYQEAKFQLALQTSRLEHGYVTLFDKQTNQNILVRQECK